MIRISKLREALGGRLSGLEGRDPVVADVHVDSRAVTPHSIFCALPGTKDDGSRFVSDAIARGASCILAPFATPLPADVPVWSHESPRSALGLAASRVHGDPSRELFTVGITGTNGKTTTAHLVHQLLTSCGKRSAVLGTAGHRLADGKWIPATHTTPDAPILHRLLARHVEQQGDSCVLEVSSHALAQERTAGIDFRVAIFTNLTRDHLDYHGDFDSYARTKARLFGGLSGDACAIVNADDSASTIMADAARKHGARVLTFSIGSRADLFASDLVTERDGTSFFLSGMGIARTRVKVPLAGRFNVQNALAAIAAVLMSGASPSDASEGLVAVTSAPGRLERVDVGQRGFDVFVDYAHTDDALANVLTTLRGSKPEGGRLIVVFGCGGDRDTGKRAPMGRAASRAADVAVVTSDNPRSEDPDKIIGEITAGMAPGRCSVVVQPDRRAAIREALREAGTGDVVLVAGKGHETTQEVDGEFLPFDDRVVCAEELP